MKIQSIEVFIVDLPTIRAHQLAMHTITTQTVVVACIQNEDGLEGWGEVATIGGLSYASESPEGIKLTIDTYLAPLLVGQEFTTFETICYKMEQVAKGNFYAKALVEMALIDLVGRQRNMPASDLFGGKYHQSFPVAWTLASGDTGKDIEEAQEMLDKRRHNIFKLKIGKGDPFINVEHVTKIKKALGTKASVRVDVNQAWDEPTAVRAIAALEAGGVDLIEQPVVRTNVDAMARLSKRFSIPIMADESVDTLNDAYQLAKNAAANVFALKPAKAGGLFATKKIAGIAEAAGIPLYAGTMIESTLGTAVCAHLFSTMPEITFGSELFGPLLLKDDLTVEKLQYKDFHVHVPDGPGFGMTVDLDKLQFYRRDRSFA